MANKVRRKFRNGFLLFCGVAAFGLYHARMVCAQNYSLQTLLNTKNIHAAQSTSAVPPCHATPTTQAASTSQSQPASPIHAKLCCDIGELANSPEQSQLKKIFSAEKTDFPATRLIIAHIDPFSTISRKLITHYPNIPPPLKHLRTTILRI